MSITTETRRKQKTKTTDCMFQLFFETNRDGMLIAHPNGTLIEVNQALCKMLGYTYDELIELKHADIVAPDDPMRQQIEAARESKGQYSGPMKFMRKDGSIVDTEVTATLHDGNNGKPTVYISVREATEKIQYEKTLRSEHRLQTLIEQGRDMITLMGANGSVIYRSPSYITQLGYDPDQMTDDLDFDNIHPDDKPTLIEAYQKLFTQPGLTIKNMWRQRHADGRWRWMEGKGTNQLHDPHINAIVSNFRDITEYVEMGEKIEERNKELNYLFNTVEEVLYSGIAEPYKLTHMSAACERIYGYPPEAFLADQDLWTELLLDEDKHFIQSISEALLMGLPATCQYRIRHRDGSIRWIESSSTPTMDETGKLVRFDGVIRDITERKKAEQVIAMSEKRFRALIENNKEGITLTDMQRRFIYLSPAVREILGYEPSELIGRAAYELYHQDDLMSMKSMVDSIHAKMVPSATGTIRMRHKNGSWRWIEFNAVDQFDEPAVGAMVTNYRDVTDRITTIEALHHSEKKFRALIEKGKDGIILTNANRCILYASPSVKEILGYEPDEVIGSQTALLQDPDDDEANKAMLKRLVTNETSSISMLVRARHKDGSIRWLELDATNLLEDPAVNAIISNFRDVTDRKKAEEILNESERKFRALIENSKDGIALSGLDRKFKYLSPAVKNILGYEPEEMIGRETRDFLNPEETLLNKEFYESLLQNNAQDNVRIIRGRHKDGSWRWIELTAVNRLDDPAMNAIVSNFRDVTERIEAAQALSGSERRFRALIENNKDMIALSSADGNMTYMSPSVTELLGYEVEELIGTSAVALMHPEEVEGNVAQLMWLTENPGQSVFKTMRLRHKDGSWRWIDAKSTSQLHDPAVAAIVSNLRDVTERVEASQKLEQMNQMLEQRVEERTRELKHTNKTLESFSYIAAHDLQAPVRAMIGYAQLVKNEYAEHIDKAGLELLDVIIDKSKHMSQLVHDLLNFSRVSHAVIDNQTIDLDTMVREVADQQQLIDNKPGTQVIIHPLGKCHADSTLIRQVWTNLIANALKYSGKKENPIVEIGCEQQGKERVYYVRDNGAGFDMAYASKLFAVFQRLHRATEFEGTGVGLAIVHNIIQRHHGRVWAEAVPDQGATFYFTIGEHTIV